MWCKEYRESEKAGIAVGRELVYNGQEKRTHQHCEGVNKPEEKKFWRGKI